MNKQVVKDLLRVSESISDGFSVRQLICLIGLLYLTIINQISNIENIIAREENIRYRNRTDQNIII